MGLNHDRYEFGVPARGANYGYVNQRMFEPDAPESARWVTIMAYGTQCGEVGGFGCYQVSYFSNPELTYKGDPMGVPADHPSTGVDGPADAVGTLNNRREIVANFRLSSVSPTPRVGLTLSPYWLSENGGVSTVTATLNRPSSADTIVTVSASPSDSVTMSGSRTLTIPAGRTEINDSVTITGIDNDDQTGDVTVEVSATVENTSSLGVIAPEPLALAVADDETTPVVSLSLSRAEVFEGGDFRERRTFVTTSLDNRSSATTTVTVSVSPAEAVEEIWSVLTIPAGQRASVGFGVRIYARDDAEFTEAEKMVTVSGTATNPLGVTGPDSVTLTIIDDDAPIFADDSITYTFTAGVIASRVLPEAEYGNGPLTYSISPAVSNGVTFAPGPPGKIGVSSTSVAAGETSYILTATDAQDDTDTMAVNITVIEGVCPNSAAISGYADPGIVADCEALLASRDALRGDQPLNWSEQLAIGDWKGIEILNNRVVGIDMSSQGLSGTIPSELGNLSGLVWLELNQNELTGTIPPELGELANLRTLSLNNNQLTGEIPSEVGNLVDLRMLNFDVNQLVGPIPVELGNLVNLGDLSLNGNQLIGEIPASLGDLVNLRVLNLSRNQLTGTLPGWLNRLNNLGVLDLGDNKLTGEIPTGLGDLTNLYWLLLGSNNLNGEIPAELGNLTELQLLDLGPNQLTGELPGWLGDLTKLRALLLRGTHLTGEIPDSLGGLTNLESLHLSNNRLTGEIPTSLSNLANLDTLDLTGNDLRGDIPAWLGSLTKLNGLRLSENQLSGEIPSELGNLANLRSLYLSYNRLTGEIPEELGTLANLRWLYLAGNELMGCIPERLGDVGSNDLEQLGLPFCDDEIEQSDCASGSAVPDAASNPGLVSDCEALLASRDTLAGTATLNWSADTPIADWDGITLEGTPQRVTKLSLVRRGLTGQIPTELGDLENLQWLRFVGNELTGEIPPELGDLTNLERLGLQNNRLSGEIPVELGNLANLQYMQLHYNELTGEVPLDFGRLANLEVLFLDNNHLTGMLPQTMTELTLLRLFYFLDNAGLCAPADDAFQTWLQNVDTFRGSTCGSVDSDEDRPVLEALYTATNGQNWENSENWLSERPLSEWYGVTVDVDGRVNGLYLRSNDLTGEIPEELSSLSGLRRLYLSSNELTGEVPEELGGLTNLERLVLSRNRLTGAIPDELENLTYLKWLLIGDNELDGEIPAWLGSFANLQYLYLDRNELTGEIPTELGGLVNLERLYLYDNQLTGAIPPQLGSLVNLEQLRLNGNQLTGAIPTELGNLSNLEILYLSDNQLTGAIPIELGNLENLRLGGNLFSGCLPSELLALEDTLENDFEAMGLVFECAVLLAARDTLAGTAMLNWSADTPVAQWDGVKLGETPQRVTRLALPNNGLDGTIPSVLGRLTMLTDLNLSTNELTGEIPDELGNLRNLRVLNLRSNELTGEIPDELGNLRNLKVLNLHSNNLRGDIPDLSRIAGLEELYLPNNADHDVDGTKKLSQNGKSPLATEPQECARKLQQSDVVRRLFVVAYQNSTALGEPC